jgi:uncharacterized protein
MTTKMVEVKLDAIRVNNMGNRALLLKDADANRYLPIWTGENEANAISIQMQGVQIARPITHDLIVSMVRELGAQIKYVVVTDMQESIYFARVVVNTRDGKEVRIDSRPSDAIAIAVRCDCPIYVEDEVMNKHAKVPDEETSTPADEDLGAFKDFLGSLDLDDLDEK